MAERSAWTLYLEPAGAHPGPELGGLIEEKRKILRYVNQINKKFEEKKHSKSETI